ncbi:hypothetical protein [Methanolobus psychrotolerans]|uniref:hypothetical protein n=1 Tax=Methanolobus psychrotolerans TaxID=1874706 RepID=UPI0013EC954B|nr:hypothetical protein [Methanolobus psychrotolerans]
MNLGVVDEIFDYSISLLKSKGLSNEDIIPLLIRDIPLKELGNNVDSISHVDGVDGLVIRAARFGINTEVRYIDNGAQFISDLGGTSLSKGELGERAAYWVVQEKGFQPLGATDGFFKDLANQEGIDLIYKDGETFVIMEAKFTSTAGNVGKGILSTMEIAGQPARQMDDRWIDDAIIRMDEKGLISSDLADQLKAAVLAGEIRKELVVVQNAPINAKTVVESLAETGLGIENVDLIKIGEVI